MGEKKRKNNEKKKKKRGKIKQMNRCLDKE